MPRTRQGFRKWICFAFFDDAAFGVAGDALRGGIGFGAFEGFTLDDFFAEDLLDRVSVD